MTDEDVVADEAVTQLGREPWAIRAPFSFAAAMLGLMFGFKLLAAPLLYVLP